MPWPAVRNLTDNDLNAVWQYLSSIPCNTDQSNYNAAAGITAAHPILVNSCTPAPQGTYKFYRWVAGIVMPVN